MSIGQMLLGWLIVNVALTVGVVVGTIGLGFWRGLTKQWQRNDAWYAREAIRLVRVKESVLVAQRRIRLAQQARDPNQWDTENE